MERQKCDYFQSGGYIYIANEWININVSYMFDSPRWHIYTRDANFLNLGFHKEEDDYWGLYLPFTETIMIIPPIENVVFVITKVVNASV